MMELDSSKCDDAERNRGDMVCVEDHPRPLQVGSCHPRSFTYYFLRLLMVPGDDSRVNNI